MLTEAKEMLHAAYCESGMSQASVYHWYNEFKSDRKSVKLIGGPGRPTTVLTKQTVNTSANLRSYA